MMNSCYQCIDRMQKSKRYQKQAEKNLQVLIEKMPEKQFIYDFKLFPKDVSLEVLTTTYKVSRTAIHARAHMLGLIDYL